MKLIHGHIIRFHFHKKGTNVLGIWGEIGEILIIDTDIFYKLIKS